MRRGTVTCRTTHPTNIYLVGVGDGPDLHAQVRRTSVWSTAVPARLAPMVPVPTKPTLIA